MKSSSGNKGRSRDRSRDSRRAFLHKKGMILMLTFGIIILVSGLATGGIVWHRQPGFCSICHTPMNSYVENYYAGDTTRMITRHASGDTIFTCVECHNSTMVEQLREGIHWLTGDYTYPLENREIGTRSFCLSTGCHEESKIIEATSRHSTSVSFSQHDPRHGKQECYTCHSMHGESVYTCNQCHRFELPQGWKAPQPNGVIAGSRP